MHRIMQDNELSTATQRCLDYCKQHGIKVQFWHLTGDVHAGVNGFLACFTPAVPHDDIAAQLDAPERSDVLVRTVLVTTE